jgi:hypothetical protein
MSRIVIVILIYHRHKPIDLIKYEALDLWNADAKIFYAFRV